MNTREGETVGVMEGLPTRVSHLEGAVDQLHQDSIRTQASISALGTQVGGLAESLKDIGNKLDDQRTRRPELGSMATLALVILAIGGMAFAPISQRVTTTEAEITALEERVLDIKSNRFTKDDGIRMEDRIDELADSLRCERE